MHSAIARSFVDWPVVSYDRLLAVLAVIPHISRPFANLMLYGRLDGGLLAYGRIRGPFHIHPELA